MNISGLDGDSLTGGALGCTSFSGTTSTMVVSVDGVDGNAECGSRWTPTGYTSDCNSLGLEKGNPEATPRCLGSAIVL